MLLLNTTSWHLNLLRHNIFWNWTLVSEYIILYSILIIIIIISITFFLSKYNYAYSQNKLVFNLFKNLVFMLFLILLVLNLFKFFIGFYSLRNSSQFLLYNLANYSNLSKYSNYLSIFSFDNIGFSDSIVLLSIISGLVCIVLLGDKNIYANFSNITYFSFFMLATIFMVYTNNLLVLFLSFEFIFIPTIYFVYKLGYVKKTDKAVKYLLQWTLSGAFLVLIVICYLFLTYKTLNVNILQNYSFTVLEQVSISLCVFIGFGIKIPVYPFHFWLTKVHVEAPAGFSIFLSGFLVKAAVYCFFFFNTLFFNKYTNTFILVVALIGIWDSSIKMWSQLDFKKLIAFATIQEMNIILLFLVINDNINDSSFILFIFIHGLLSTLMFFTVDIIQKRTITRNLIEIGGLSFNFLKIKVILWYILILFMGFPLTVKFIIEWKIVFLLYTQSFFFTLVTFLILNTVAVIGFTKQFLILLYGETKLLNNLTIDITKRDTFLFYFVGYILFLLNFFSLYI